MSQKAIEIERAVLTADPDAKLDGGLVETTAYKLVFNTDMPPGCVLRFTPP